MATEQHAFFCGDATDRSWREYPIKMISGAKTRNGSPEGRIGSSTRVELADGRR
jgi:hypothetical protein